GSSARSCARTAPPRASLPALENKANRARAPAATPARSSRTSATRSATPTRRPPLRSETPAIRARATPRSPKASASASARATFSLLQAERALLPLLAQPARELARRRVHVRTRALRRQHEVVPFHRGLRVHQHGR